MGWTLLDTGVRNAYQNLALDRALLHSRAAGESPNTLRFMEYSPDAVLVGFHQNTTQELRMDHCIEKGLDIGRRITGGGALYFDQGQLGWEIIADRAHSALDVNVEALYRVMCEAVALGLRDLGLDACFRPRNDIEVNGRKISGTGGVQEGSAFLFQGTLLTDFDVDGMLRALRIPVEKLKSKELASVRRRVTCLKEQLGVVPPMDEIKAAITHGFEQALGVSFKPRDLLPQELERMEQALTDMSSEEWIHGLRRPLDSRSVLLSRKKTKGGLIRVALVLDSGAHQLQSVLMIGDFFAHPQRAVMDLEAHLKYSSSEPSDLESNIRNFFSQENTELLGGDVGLPGGGVKFIGVNVELPSDDMELVDGDVELPSGDAELLGVSVDEVVCVFLDALGKSKLTKYGFEPEDANRIFTVLGDFEGIAKPEVLLLPYCAKSGQCGWRYIEGCACCGNCSTGSAHELGEKYGLEVITVQSFADLMKKLFRLRSSGVSSYIGSCCEPFYVKHQQDFESSGLMGVLVDIDARTCYDLDLEEDAYLGKFDRLTELRLDLLEQVIRTKMEVHP